MSEELDIANATTVLAYPYKDRPWVEYLEDIMQRRIDPKGKSLYSSFFTLVFFSDMFPEMEGDDETPPDNYAETVGEMVTSYLTRGTVEQTEKMFTAILKLKRNFDSLPRREFYAWCAFKDYWKETGQAPTDRQLRKYMECRRDVYRDQPSPDSPWTELWRDSGLRDYWDSQNMDLDDILG